MVRFCAVGVGGAAPVDLRTIFFFGLTGLVSPGSKTSSGRS